MCGCLEQKHPPYEVQKGEAPKTSDVRNRVLRICANVKERPLTSSHGSWQVLHGILAYGQEFEFEVGNTPSLENSTNGKVSALKYLLEGGDLAGWDFFPGDILPNGRRGLRSSLDAGSYSGQGHSDQWLAVLAQASLSLETELVVNGRAFLMQDLLDQTLLDVAQNQHNEFSWTLIGVTAYKPTSSTWVASDGARWSVEKLVGYELNADLQSSACGGSHRLIGIAMTVNRRRQEAEQMDGIWRQAETRLREHAALVRAYQNSDGSFSTNYFARTGISADNATVLATTGHTLELLALTLTPEELRQGWVLRAVNRLCRLLEDSEGHALECGALYHAIHGLRVFYDRTAIQ